MERTESRLVIFELTNNMFPSEWCTHSTVYYIHCSLINFELKFCKDIWIPWLRIPSFLHDNLRLRFACFFLATFNLNYIFWNTTCYSKRAKKCSRNAEKGRKTNLNIRCTNPILKIQWHGASFAIVFRVKNKTKTISEYFFLVLSFDWLAIFMAVANLHLQHFSWLIMQMHKMCCRDSFFSFGASSGEKRTHQASISVLSKFQCFKRRAIATGWT